MILILLPLIILLIIVLYIRFQYNRKPSSIQVLKDLDEIKLLLSHKGSVLSTRALPNQRLVKAFGINNSFTTTSKEYYNAFQKRVKALLQRNQAEWDATAAESRSLVAAAIANGRNELHLVPFVREYVLRIIRSIFFKIRFDPINRDHRNPPSELFAELGELINVLWIRSKDDGTPSPLDQKRLAELVTGLFPSSGSGSDNPLNIILPAYETMWRVVLCCFLEVHFRAPACGCWRQQLQGYLSSPTARAFNSINQASCHQVSVAYIVRETLRMYPPTKRIYRAGGSNGLVVVADIETVQLSSFSIWGNDPCVFRPERWSSVNDKDRNDNFLTFGQGAFVCPAKEFAPRLVGILVAALLQGIPGHACNEEALEGQRLKNDRNGYKSLVLKW